MGDESDPQPGAASGEDSDEGAAADAPREGDPTRGVDAAVDREVREVAKEAEQQMDEALRNVRRVYVAVHGIGEQFQFETVQHVANRLGKYVGSAMPIPLGSFHSYGVKQWGFLPLTSPPYPDRFKEVGLAEIYWADIPREVQKEGHTLEEAKKWAATLVGRIWMREKGGKDAPLALDYQMLEQVVGEMIEGIAILDRLCSLVGKVSPFRLQIRELLNSFLGDVQVVTDFEIERIRLLAQFHAVMDRIWKANPKVDLYIVAHSEGTVVTFLALLKAFKEYQPRSAGQEEQFGWIKQVKGLMTIGSPIEVHLILWPELWRAYRCEKDEEGAPKPAYRWKPESEPGRIKWRNYYDYGDPVAYRMEATREWIKENRWDAVFEYEGPTPTNPAGHEFTFSRYLFPGKAHVDYWRDEEVFGHFIETVVHGGDRSGDVDTDTAWPKGRFADPPRSFFHVRLFSRVVPYFFPAALLFTGVYIVFRAISVRAASYETVFWDVGGITLLLLGITVASRVPRLTRSRKEWIAAYFIFLATAAACPKMLSPIAINFLAGPIEEIFSWTDWDRFRSPLDDFYPRPALGIMLIAAVFVLGVMKISAAFPRLGAKTLIVPASILTLGIVLYGINASNDVRRGPLWSILLAEAAFLYLWWLAVLLFDLIYAWHHYVRGSYSGATVTDRLRTVCKDPTTAV